MAEEKKLNQHTYRRLAVLIVFVLLIVGATWAINSLKKSAADETKKEISHDFNGNKIKLELRQSMPYHLNVEKSFMLEENQRTAPGMKKKDLSPGSVLHLAERDMENGDFSAAEDKLRTALVFHGRNTKLHALLGKVLFLQEKYQEAEVIFRQQAYLDPEDTISLNNLSTALAKQKKYSEAIGTLSQLLKSDPKSSAALVNLAGMYAVSGDKKNALLYFRKSYELLGHRILLIAESSSFASLRQEKEFIEIIEEAKRDFRKSRNADRSAGMKEGQK